MPSGAYYDIASTHQFSAVDCVGLMHFLRFALKVGHPGFTPWLQNLSIRASEAVRHSQGLTAMAHCLAAEIRSRVLDLSQIEDGRQNIHHGGELSSDVVLLPIRREGRIAYDGWDPVLAMSVYTAVCKLLFEYLGIEFHPP
jgi:hypothetical protein